MADGQREPVTITYDRDGAIEIHITAGSIKAAKAAIKRLRLEKKQITTQKRQVNLELRELRAEARRKRANRGPAIRGRGGFFRALRTIDQLGRSADRRNLENAVAPYEAHKAKLDRNIAAIDQGIHHLEGWIIEREIEAARSERP